MSSDKCLFAWLELLGTWCSSGFGIGNYSVFLNLRPWPQSNFWFDSACMLTGFFFSWKSCVIMASNFLHFPCWSFFLACFWNLWPCSEKDTKERTDTRRSQSTGPHQHLWDAGLTSQRWWQEEPFNWSTQADNPSVWHWPASLLCCSQRPVLC